jgi:hypothetical protein
MQQTATLRWTAYQAIRHCFLLWQLSNCQTLAPNVILFGRHLQVCMTVALQGCMIIVLQGCVIVALQGCMIIVLQGCVIVALQGCVIAQC